VVSPYGKCALRKRERIQICPTRPIVTNPQFNINFFMEKIVGLVGSKEV
jgi:hypothetical protein